jgi:hypothetical protein
MKTEAQSKTDICHCWQTGKYVWTERCVVHPIRHPMHFSHSELIRIQEYADHGNWDVIERIRERRDGPVK